MTTEFTRERAVTAEIGNVPEPGSRDVATDNEFGLQGVDHVALPTRNIRLLERFMREVLGGRPFYYAGFDETDRQMGRRPHVFARVGRTLFQFTEEPNAVLNGKDDSHISPHTAFRVTAADLDRNTTWLKRQGIPVAGPYGHRDSSAVSVYFQSPEGHKLELVTWEPYPADKVTMIGVKGARVDWPSLANNWPNSGAL
jgi:catechol 2,3-dioxygenase-like lactoylglutathione lyase family enzyme